MNIQRFYFLPELRAKLSTLGYEVIEEREIQGGHQLRCDHGAIATCYHTGVTLAQGKNAATLARQLREDGGELDYSTRNRVIVLTDELSEDARIIAQFLKPCAILAIPFDVAESDDDDLEMYLRRHRPFSQVGMVVGTREELAQGGVLEGYIRDLVFLFGAMRVLVISPDELNSVEGIIESRIKQINYKTGSICEIIPDLVKTIAKRCDDTTRQIIERNFDALN